MRCLPCGSLARETKIEECNRLTMWAGTGWAGCVIAMVIMLVVVNSDGRMPIAVSFSIVGGVGGFEAALALLRFSLGRDGGRPHGQTTVISEPSLLTLYRGSLPAA